jgi:Arylsulfotransferase (ASST)
VSLRLTAALGAAIVLGTGAAGVARSQTRRRSEADLTLTTYPALRPAYDPAKPDYTVACAGLRTLIIEAKVPSGERLSVDAHAPQSGAVAERFPLVPGQELTFTVTSAGRSVSHSVRCTPQGFPTWQVRRNAQPHFKWLILTPQNGAYVIITDNWGVPVWWVRSPSGQAENASVLRDGSVAWWNPDGSSADADEGYYTIDSLTGARLRTVEASTADGHGEVGANLHDFHELPGGDFLLFTEAVRAVADLAPYGGPDAPGNVIDAIIQELSPTGALLWSWDSADHIAPAETQWGGQYTATSWDGATAYDVVHMNSLQEIDANHCRIAPTASAPATCNILFSARYLNAVYSVSMATGKINWKLGGTYVPGESLSFRDDPYGDFDGQHFARIQPDGDLTLLDNGTLHKHRRPRAVEYRLGSGTATLLQEITDPRIEHSSCCGSAQLLPGGDWLIDWGGNPITTEITPHGAHVFSLTLRHGYSFRAIIVSPTVTRGQLIAGMNAQFARARAG